MSKVIDITNETFEAEVLASGTPVLVDFWTNPCPPCVLVAPWLDEFAVELGDDIKIVKARIEDNSNAIEMFGVRGAPSFLIFKDGVVVARQPGLPDRSRLLLWIRHAIGDSPSSARDHEWVQENA